MDAWEWPSRIDRAINAGFDPSQDYGCQPVDPDAPLPPHIIRHNHQASADGCHDCGHRCDYCDDRMCARWGPAPEPTCGAHSVCEDCAADHHCRECQTARATEREAS